MNLFTDDLYIKYFNHAWKIFLVFLGIGIIIGYFIPYEVTIPVIKSVMQDSASAKLMSIREEYDNIKVLLYFINNSIVALFLMIIPMIYSSIIGERQPNRFRIDSIWISRLILIMQALPIGIVIGFGSVIINNNIITITSLLPHGIIEICGMMVASALGIWFGMHNHIKETYGYKGIMAIFVNVVLPLIFLAAVIETYITPYLITIVS